MKTINDYRPITNSLQSMIIMNGTKENTPAVGKYLTMFYYTDRRSYKIAAFDGKTIVCENGLTYSYWKDGSIRVGREKCRNARITTCDHNYTDESF